ncbi:GNAT family N-acetyltransferase [Sporosarcina sp. A2]|uniref:GNAT family N-acetyltransferase n=1 Tax=Sporosarcina sp. A2 TaxID=3393449 RepID=UPI003D7BA185
MDRENNIMHLIKIRNISVEDYYNILNWSKDDTFCEANGWEINRSAEELYSWWLRCVDNKSKDFIRKAILLEDKLVGYADLVFVADNKAELGIAIGDSKLWGNGIGTNSILCMMKYASEKFGMTSFYAEIHEGNTRSRKMFEKIGFLEISRISNEEYLGIDNQLIQYRFQ